MAGSPKSFVANGVLPVILAVAGGLFGGLVLTILLVLLVH
jgi:hypothetical protein